MQKVFSFDLAAFLNVIGVEGSNCEMASYSKKDFWLLTIYRLSETFI